MQVVVQFALVNELRMLRIHRLYLHCNLQVSFGIYCLVDLSECSFVDLTDDLEVLPHLLQHLRH